jgi:hypothetical protein
MKVLRLAAAVAAVAVHAATIDYVDSAHGKDSNTGTAPGAPWETLEKVNTMKFGPGDCIWFKTGSVWRGQLTPTGSGIEGAPVVLDAYGEGPKPHIDGAGQVEHVVRLYNVRYIEVRNLEIGNHGAQPSARRGVHVLLDNFGTAKHILRGGMYIYDVNGTNAERENGGIIFRTNGNRTPSRFDGLTPSSATSSGRWIARPWQRRAASVQGTIRTNEAEAVNWSLPC